MNFLILLLLAVSAPCLGYGLWAGYSDLYAAHRNRGARGTPPDQEVLIFDRMILRFAVARSLLLHAGILGLLLLTRDLSPGPRVFPVADSTAPLDDFYVFLATLPEKRKPFPNASPTDNLQPPLRAATPALSVPRANRPAPSEQTESVRPQVAAASSVTPAGDSTNGAPPGPTLAKKDPSPPLPTSDEIGRDPSSRPTHIAELFTVRTLKSSAKHLVPTPSPSPLPRGAAPSRVQSEPVPPALKASPDSGPSPVPDGPAAAGPIQHLAPLPARSPFAGATPREPKKAQPRLAKSALTPPASEGASAASPGADPDGSAVAQKPHDTGAALFPSPETLLAEEPATSSLPGDSVVHTLRQKESAGPPIVVAAPPSAPVPTTGPQGTALAELQALKAVSPSPLRRTIPQPPPRKPSPSAPEMKPVLGRIPLEPRGASPSTHAAQTEVVPPVPIQKGAPSPALAAPFVFPLPGTVVEGTPPPSSSKRMLAWTAPTIEAPPRRPVPKVATATPEVKPVAERVRSTGPRTRAAEAPAHSQSAGAPAMRTGTPDPPSVPVPNGPAVAARPLEADPDPFPAPGTVVAAQPAAASPAGASVAPRPPAPKATEVPEGTTLANAPLPKTPPVQAIRIAAPLPPMPTVLRPTKEAERIGNRTAREPRDVSSSSKFANTKTAPPVPTQKVATPTTVPTPSPPTAKVNPLPSSTAEATFQKPADTSFHHVMKIPPASQGVPESQSAPALVPPPGTVAAAQPAAASPSEASVAPRPPAPEPTGIRQESKLADLKVPNPFPATSVHGVPPPQHRSNMSLQDPDARTRPSLQAAPSRLEARESRLAQAGASSPAPEGAADRPPSALTPDGAPTATPPIEGGPALFPPPGTLVAEEGLIAPTASTLVPFSKRGFGGLRVQLEGPRTRVTHDETETVSGKILGGVPLRLVLSVNGTESEVATDDGGSFQTAISLQPGLNHLRAVARDWQGVEADDTITIEFVSPPVPNGIAITTPQDGHTLPPDAPPVILVEGRVESRDLSNAWLVANDRRIPIRVHNGRFRKVLPVLDPILHLWAELPPNGGSPHRSRAVTVRAPSPSLSHGLLVMDWPQGIDGKHVVVQATWRAHPERLDVPPQKVPLTVFGASPTDTLPEAFSLRTKPGVYTFMLRGRAVSVSGVRATLVLPEANGLKAHDLGPISLNGSKVVLAKVLLPHGVFWEQDEWFTGQSESADTMTKFRFPEGISWTEHKRNLD